MCWHEVRVAPALAAGLQQFYNRGRSLSPSGRENAYKVVGIGTPKPLRLNFGPYSPDSAPGPLSGEP